MSRIATSAASLVLALAASTIALSPVIAAGPSARATLASPVAGTVTAMGTEFACTPDGCAAARVAGEPASSTLCDALVRRAGPVTAFAVNGREFSERALTKCNRAAG